MQINLTLSSHRCGVMYPFAPWAPRRIYLHPHFRFGAASPLKLLRRINPAEEERGRSKRIFFMQKALQLGERK
jgi:hypothetical protein